MGLAPTGPAQALFKTASRFVRQLELFRVYTKRDYRDGLPDKAEWGQGIIATFESGFTQGPIGFGVDCIAQYAVRLDGVAGPAACALINPLYRTAQGVTGVIRPFSPPGCTASPAPGSPPPER
ncbi:TPA: OprD family outer membrane porin [Klebsiella pneumoniae]|nr:OprD family outer membrane porin [Klebsiella pneumoniae]HDH0756663.1 OprD family outer membrane porin [Klebsiella pneumoniae]